MGCDGFSDNGNFQINVGCVLKGNAVVEIGINSGESNCYIIQEVRPEDHSGSLWQYNLSNLRLLFCLVGMLMT